MDKAKGLIRLAPVIHGIDNWVCGYLREVLEGYVNRLKSDDEVIEDIEGAFGYIRDFRSDATDEFGNAKPEDDEGQEKESSLERACKLLNHPNIRHIDDGGLAELRVAVSTMMTSADKRELTDAARTLEQACYEFLDHFYLRLPDHLLGEWGGKLFRYMMVGDFEEARSLADSLGSEFVPTDLSVDRAVVIDNDTFSVQIGNRPPCSLGNSLQFKLLAHLVSRPNRYVSFVELAEAIGGDEFDREAVIVAKCRLCKRLSIQGYDDLANLIVTQPDHYSYWPS
jgi:hypothetical protein